MSLKKQCLKKLLVVCLLITSAYADDFDFDIGDISFEQLEAYEQAHDLDPFSIRALNPPAIAVQLQKITSPLWKNTKAPAGRDTLYLLPHKITAVEYGGFALSYFFNMTTQMDVTINDLFSIPENINFDDLLKSFLPAGTEPQEVAQLLPLFKKITLQDRKSGLLLQGGFIKGPFTVQLNTSLQLGARNFWLNKQDQKTIKDLFSNEYGGGTLEDKEFYMIRIGLGDTRLKIGLNTINMTSLQSDIGFETIIPTSRFSLTRNLKIGLAQTTFDSDIDKTKSTIAMKAIRDYLLTPQLGNGGHFGLGCYTESKIGIFHELAQLWMRASYDVLFPNEEDRLFMFKQLLTPSDLNPVIDVFHPLPENEQKRIVNEYVQQYIFPSSFKSSVYPGGVVNFVAAISADFTPRTKGSLGYDFYAQGMEKIKQIQNTSVDINDLRVDAAQSSSVVQHKVFTEFLYHNKKEKSDIGIAIGGDITVSARNIGEDFTIYLKLASSF